MVEGMREGNWYTGRNGTGELVCRGDRRGELVCLREGGGGEVLRTI